MGEKMNKIYLKLLIVIVLLGSITYIQFPYIKEGINYFVKNDNKKEDIIVNITIDGKTIKKDLDEYLLGVVAGEMPAEFEEEALKAQVVASRTFVLSRDLKVDNTTNSQVYLTEEQMKKITHGINCHKGIRNVEKAIFGYFHNIKTNRMLHPFPFQ